ncbi:MAG: hypothetical protein F6K24_57695 [Okeania sp. SIO2D1]|nr:hypothetical protein [Okeania sp. SIO2D1]
MIVQIKQKQIEGYEQQKNSQKKENQSIYKTGNTIHYFFIAPIKFDF